MRNYIEIFIEIGKNFNLKAPQFSSNSMVVGIFVNTSCKFAIFGMEFLLKLFEILQLLFPYMRIEIQ